jgi:hypothetical protein
LTITSQLPLIDIPEGSLDKGLLARFFLKGERIYDPLWPYISRNPSSLYRSQESVVRIEEYGIGLRTAKAVPVWIDFKSEVLHIGRKLQIPFPSFRSLMIAHRGDSTEAGYPFEILIRVDGCDKYLRLHWFGDEEQVPGLAEFLSKRMRVPLGIASDPFDVFLKPGRSSLLYGSKKLMLHDLRAVLASRDPNGVTNIAFLTESGKIPFFSQKDPDSLFERWGTILDSLIGVAGRRNYWRASRENTW